MTKAKAAPTEGRPSSSQPGLFENFRLLWLAEQKPALLKSHYRPDHVNRIVHQNITAYNYCTIKSSKNTRYFILKDKSSICVLCGFNVNLLASSHSETLAYAAFTLNGFDDQERNLTFVKTDF